MARRLWLVAVWALFASAAIGVGFAAAGLVGDELDEPPSQTRLTPGPAATEPTTPGSATTAPTGSGSSTPEPSQSSSPRSPTPGATSTSPSRTANPPRPSAAPVTRSVQTRAGVVVATCRNGLVRLGTSPAVGWGIDQLETGWRSEAKVRFEREDERVEVKARCSGGNPRFELDDDARDGDEDGGDDGGGDDGGGEDNSGSGSTD